MPETPDAWGGDGAVAFGGAVGIRFRSGDGALVDQNDVYVNGRVFVARAGSNSVNSAGMVSIFGPTGRIRSYRLQGETLELPITPARRAPLGTAARKTGQEGFSVVEVLAAVSLLAVGLLSLAGVFTMALGRMTTATWDILAKEKASETIENMLAARDAGRLPFASINNVGNGGIFLAGAARACRARPRPPDRHGR